MLLWQADFQLLIAGPVFCVLGGACLYECTVLLPSQPSSFCVHPGVCSSRSCGFVRDIIFQDGQELVPE